MTKEVAEMAELGDAADSKSAVLKGAWGFESPSRHFREQDTGNGELKYRSEGIVIQGG